QVSDLHVPDVAHHFLRDAGAGRAASDVIGALHRQPIQRRPPGGIGAYVPVGSRKFGDRRVGLEVGRTVGATVGRIIQALGTVAREELAPRVVDHRDVFIVVVGDLGNGGVWLRPRERAKDDDVAGLEISGGLVDL